MGVDFCYRMGLGLELAKLESTFMISIFSSLLLAASSAFTDKIYWPGFTSPTGLMVKSWRERPGGSPVMLRMTGDLEF